MKKTLAAMILCMLWALAIGTLAEESAFEVLPMPQVDVTSSFGTDVNVNMATIDAYLNLSDAAYRDMRMLNDPYDYEAIGGSSLLTGMIEGFVLVPYPYIAPCVDMPEALGEGYAGPTLFSIDGEGHYAPNYEESLAILESLFPKDQAILLMCGAGGYAGMMKNLLISLGWDENMIMNVGGYWDYRGDHAVQVLSEEAAGVLRFDGVEFVEFDFGRLTPVK